MLVRWWQENTTILANAGSLVGTRAVTSALGVVYWWLAARLFLPESVGVGSAAISAMMLLSMVGVVGFTTLLVGELSRRPEDAGSLIATALVASGLASVVLGAGFALIAPRLSDDLASLAESLSAVALFAGGVGLSSMTLVLDQALLGLLCGQVQMWRNTIFAAAKIVALSLVLLLPTWDRGLMLYASWGLGNLVSLLCLSVWWLPRGKGAHRLRPQWGLLRDLRGPALRHHALNLSLQVPGYILPVLVTVVLSARSTASFYTAFMVTSLLFTMPHALTTVLYAVGAADPSLLAEKMRFTLRLSLLLGTLGAAFLLAGAHPIMYTFGETYAAQATGSLRVLTIAIFPVIVKVHYVAVCQIHGRVLEAARIMMAGGVIELSLAALGAHLGGQIGLCLGWVIAICLEALAAAPLVYRMATSDGVVRSVKLTG